MATLPERFQAEYLAYHKITAARQRETLTEISRLESRLQADGRALEQVVSSDFQGYAGDLIAGGYHVNTVRKKMTMLRAFFSWAFAADVISAETYLKLKGVSNPRGSTGRTTPKPYTRAELKQFWAELDAALPRLPLSGRGSRAIERWIRGIGPWGRVWRHAMRLQVDCMVRLALDLGLRASEIYDLSVDDLHYDNETIVVRGKADPNTGHVKVREVPYTDDARTAVYRWLEFRALMRPSHDRPWLSCYADARTHPMWKSRFETLLQDVVGPSWSWHRYRHTCGTLWARSGMDLAYVQRLLGHSTIHQTLMYAEIDNPDVAREMARHESTFKEMRDAA